MRNTFVILAVLVALVIGFAIVRPVLAQVAATSTDITEASPTSVDLVASSSPIDATTSSPAESLSGSTTAPVQATPTEATTTAESSSVDAAPDTSLQKAPIEPPPPGLTEVHIIGTKYIDYFTDGSTTIAVPGDPKTDGNLDKPDAPIPTHEGMTWVHTTGGYLYDTPSGDLEVGDYAVQRNGSYITNAPPFVSSTSTPAQLTTSATTGNETGSSTSVTDNPAAGTSSPTTSDASPSAPDTSTSTPTAPSDSSASTTSPEPTTSPAT